MTLTVTLLGTGSPIPDPDRAGPAMLVRTPTTNLLVDAGRGVLMRLAAAGLFPPALDAVLMTHLHSDHLADLNDVITTHWVMNATPTPLPVYGPVGTAEVVDGILAMLAPDIRYRLAHHDDLVDAPRIEVHELEPPTTIELGDARVVVGATDHRPVEPTLGYRVEHGASVAVLGGDGVPSPDLDALCADADVYVQTVIRPDLVAQVPSERLHDIVDYHSSVEQAAQTAARAGVDTLVCTHVVPPLTADRHDECRALAAAHFDGEILLADDLATVELP